MFKWAAIFTLFFAPAASFAQAAPATVGGTATFWAGGEISSFNPDYSCSSNKPFGCNSQLVGPAAFFDMNVRPKWGIEGEARWLHWNGPGGQIESNYLGGGRYRVARYHRLDAWVKLLVGAGLITTPNYPAAGSLKGSYFAYAPGGTLDFRLTPRISIRGDYEYQFWPSFAGPPTFNSTTGTFVQHADGLTPNGFSLGVTYKFLGP
ncbi:MAG TPA: outer membrane beta-barrel protein [Acidobacteriaceae bacterium]|nr:outer membrane beta-barrel protein [Acidobacteriaceae bacterium]